MDHERGLGGVVHATMRVVKMELRISKGGFLSLTNSKAPGVVDSLTRHEPGGGEVTHVTSTCRSDGGKKES